MRPIPLGTIAIAAHHSKGDRNALTGTLQIRATTVPEDLPRWRNEADRLLEHIRRVMSIAAASLLRSPITEFFAGGVNEVTALSQIAQGQAGLRAIRSQRQKEFFSAAVTSFFTPPIAAEQLFFAIEWFAMDVTYNEMRLVCAMTALENLIEANLEDSERFIEEPGGFERVVLVDGDRLAELMIDHEVGVAARTIKVPRLDGDSSTKSRRSTRSRA